ncbi:MAG: biopolymer transporter ExbD [Alloprevotella sp.]|nr:biopolymer transporter ExbD [Alloprevotella sp.]
MGRFKIKKQDTFIDMTPMSDVMVLLLTFFMLTATFVKEEPIQVQTPGSVSEIKIPEHNVLTIFVNPAGKVYMTLDSKNALGELADKMTEGGHLAKLNDDERKAFSDAPTFGTPLSLTKTWLAPENADKRNDLLRDPAAGIPCDSTHDELKLWVQAAREVCGESMRIAIKADQATSYAVIKKVMDSLRHIHENRYNLITSLKGIED